MWTWEADPSIGARGPSDQVCLGHTSSCTFPLSCVKGGAVNPSADSLPSPRWASPEGLAALSALDLSLLTGIVSTANVSSNNFVTTLGRVSLTISEFAAKEPFTEECRLQHWVSLRLGRGLGGVVACTKRRMGTHVHAVQCKPMRLLVGPGVVRVSLVISGIRSENYG